MVGTVLIAPVGIYETRVWKSILRSGAERIYLIKGKGSYQDATEDVSKALKNRLIEHLMLKNDQINEDETVNFANFADIYRTFTKVIELERLENPTVKVVIDISSTTKTATLVSSLLSNLYDLTISFVPPLRRASKRMVDARLKSDRKNPDEGGEYMTIKMRRGRGLGPDEILALEKAQLHKGYDSMIDFIREMAKEEQKNESDARYKRYWIRVLHSLEDNGLLRIYEMGLTKSFNLTEAGLGILEGIQAARKHIEKSQTKASSKT